MLVAVSLEIAQSAAETLFNGNDQILIINDEVWLPFEMSSFNEGFMASWKLGASKLKQYFAEGKEVDFIKLEEAWAAFPPAPLPEQGGRIVRTDQEAARRQVDRVIQQYVDQELAPLTRQLEAQINSRPAGDSSLAALHNRLGILMVRSGRTEAAKGSYERAAGLGSVPAMTNRASLAVSERDYSTAERWYRQAIIQDGGNAAAKRGLELVEDRR